MNTNPPNIILIMMDAVRAQNLLFYGYKQNTMPNLNKIIDEFVVYQNAISSNNWTLTSVASTLTGTYLSNHGLVFDGDKLIKKLITIPEYLQNKGYDTLLFSTHPYISRFSGLDRGFGKVFDKTPVNGFKLYEMICNKVRSLKKSENGSKPKKDENNSKKVNSNFLTELHLFMRWYLTYFSERDARYKVKNFKKLWGNKDIDKPFYALFHLFETHTPYIIPNKYRNKFLEKSLKKCKLWNIPQGVVYPKGMGMKEIDFRINEGIYNGAINYLDQIILNLIKFLKDENLWDDTLFVIFSDHGENLGDHGLMFHKFVLYDTLIKIPLMIKG